jgi:hypothetical protein
MMSILSTIRLATWGAAILFSLITLALAAHFTSITLQPSTVYGYYSTYTYRGVYFPFAAMAIATSLLTLLTLPPFIGIDYTRTGAPTSMIMTEMIVVTILWILWLVTGSLTANETFGRGLSGCTLTICHEYNAIEAFSFLAFIFLLGYAFTLLVFTLIAHNRGHSSVWTQSIKETNFFAPPVNAPGGTPATGVVNEKAGYNSPAPQYPPVSPYNAPGALPQQQFQQPPFQQQQFQQQPFQPQQVPQQQFQQPPPQGGYPYPAGSPQPLQPQNTGPVVQPFNQV